jgi:tetratricopeptide (TPR) repeat protein
MTGTESSALQEAIEMSDSDRRRILALARLVPNNNPWVLLGVEQGGPLQDVKRAYFRLSKEVHPDRYYGKRLGSFAIKLNEVFEAVTRAYTELSSKSKKPSNTSTTATDTPQTPQEYALELFERACASEVSGDSEAAMKLFAAVVRMQPQLRYLRRAASCALTAAQPRTALEYAKKASALAPDDASLARLLAQSFRAAGQLEQAEEVLVMAMAIKSENDVLTMELRNELAAVRRAIGR